MQQKSRLRVIFSALFILLFAAAALSAQTDTQPRRQLPAGWYYNKPIKSIRFEGLRNIKAADVESVTQSFVNKPFTDELYSDLLGRIYALEYFDDIVPRSLPGDEKDESVVLIFTVVERPVVSRLIFSGNKEIRDRELRDAVSLKEKDIFIASKVLMDERALREHYLKAGYTNIKISSKTTEPTENGIEVTFIIDEGSSTIVTAILFDGNQVFAAKTLRGELETKTKGVTKKRGAFQEMLLESDRQALLKYYQNKGYIDVTIPEILRTANFNEKEKRTELTLTYIIREGVQYTFDGITFVGNVIFSAEQLNARIKQKVGEIFNYGRFHDNLDAVADLYYENGYTSNMFSLDMVKDAERRRVSFTYAIVERPRSHIERIIIRGNTKTKDHVILREMPIQSGDIFSKEKITSGLRNLLNLQYFSAIVPDIVPGSEENLVDLIINVEEQSTTSIEFGLTFSGIADPDDFPVSLFVKLSDSNIRGSGKTASVNTVLSPDQQTLELGYGDSWLFNLPLNISVNAGVTHRSLAARQNMYYPSGTVDNMNHYMDYEQWSISLGASVGRRWFPDFAILSWTGGISGNLLKNIYDAALFEPYDTTIRKYEEKWGFRNTIWTAVSLDDRDINYDPSKGWFFNQRVAWTGLFPALEAEFFLRLDTKGEIYFTLLDWKATEKWHLKFVLAGYTGFSFLFPTEKSALSETSKLYIDGMFNGRGWNMYRDVYEDTRGEVMWSSYLELRMPLLPGVLAFDFFFDAVAIENKPSDLFVNLSMDDWYFSFGPGLRFSMPQFPLRLLLANTFQVLDGNVAWKNASGPQWQFVLSFNITNR